MHKIKDTLFTWYSMWAVLPKVVQWGRPKIKLFIFIRSNNERNSNRTITKEKQTEQKTIISRFYNVFLMFFSRNCSSIISYHSKKAQCLSEICHLLIMPIPDRKAETMLVLFTDAIPEPRQYLVHNGQLICGRDKLINK